MQVGAGLDKSLCFIRTTRRKDTEITGETEVEYFAHSAGSCGSGKKRIAGGGSYREETGPMNHRLTTKPFIRRSRGKTGTTLPRYVVFGGE